MLLVAGIGHLLQTYGGTDPVDAAVLLDQFLPPHVTVGGKDPFAFVERVVGQFASYQGRLSLVAVPAFLWFSTRLFAGTRTALNVVFDSSVRPPERHAVVHYLLGKLRDLGMVLLVLTLFMGNTVLSAALAVIQAAGKEAVPEFGFFVSRVGWWLGEILALGFIWTLYFLVYRFASMRRLSTRAAQIAALFSAVSFEIAKRLFGLYLVYLGSSEQISVDANLAAILLLGVWMYYTALVFLLGGVVARIWEEGAVGA